MSRWPIIRQFQSIFEVCGGSDCFAQKGVMYALINKEGRCYHLLGTHVQAGVEKWPVRMQQFQAIRDFVASAYIRSDEPVIIAGDFNEDRYGERYREMLGRMEAGQPHYYAGPAYTVSPEGNDLNDGRCHRYYDYVLYSRNHLQPVSSLNEVRVLHSAERWREYPWARWHLDLSDHYPVFGRYAFPPTAGLPCPSAGAYRDLSIAGPSQVSAGARYRLDAVPEGGGPDFRYLWNDGATTARIEAVAGELGTSQRWRVEVTDVREGKTRVASTTVSAVPSR